MSRSTSSVALMYSQAESAKPPMTASGTCNGSSVRQACLSVSSTGLFAKPATQLLSHMDDHLIVLFHLLLIPLAMCGDEVAVGADFAAKTGQKELFACVHQIEPSLNAFSGWHWLRSC